MKTDYLYILPECYIDTNLVQILLQIKGVNHQNSCGQVTNVLQQRFKNSFAIGVVDNDKKQSTYSKESIAIACSNELTLCKHPGSSHYLIKINNIMEKFIMNCADELNIDFQQYGIPSDLEGFKRITKQKDSLNNTQLKSVLKAITHSNEMALLKEVLEYLITNRYDSNDDDLKLIFANHGFTVCD